MILSGDTEQLGPVIVSELANNLGLGESLLARLFTYFPYVRDEERHPETNGFDPRLVTKLVCNYRSLPEILQLYSGLFYESTLESMVIHSAL